ncbi:uncharacterized protein VP01_2156g1 [Puccinia sorghi]|uniref:Uncharacterized protein n=1 Tax=Puccinia sorghi TaxID=27349 RepID=A0A0L6V9I4_9BASI|nr:uncharacterized protein VP01_2156g1 [Puccinia sorghi]
MAESFKAVLYPVADRTWSTLTTSRCHLTVVLMLITWIESATITACLLRLWSGPRKDQAFYRESSRFEFSDFYSDEEADDTYRLRPQRCKTAKSVAVTDAQDNVGLSSFSPELKILATNDNPPIASLPARSTRKRSLTNLFKVKPDTLSAYKIAELSSSTPVDISPQSFSTLKLDDLPGLIATTEKLAGHFQNDGFVNQREDTSVSTACPNINVYRQEEGSLSEIEGLHDRSPIFKNPEIPIVNQSRQTFHKAASASISRIPYLSQARTKLKNKTITRSISVGYQPCRKGITCEDENECFQKIWMHQENRIEAHQKMKPKLKLILEEEELHEMLEQFNTE